MSRDPSIKISRPRAVQHVSTGVIREAHESDIPAIIDLYTRLNDPNILPRSEEEYKDAIGRAGFFIVTARDLVVAASGVFPVSLDPLYLEFGGTAVDYPERGFGLQKYSWRLEFRGALFFFRTDFRAEYILLLIQKKTKNQYEILSIPDL